MKNGPNPACFCLFLFFSHDKYSTNTINEKSVAGVLGTQTRGGKMVGADESTELWRHPINMCFVPTCKISYQYTAWNEQVVFPITIPTDIKKIQRYLLVLSNPRFHVLVLTAQNILASAVTFCTFNLPFSVLIITNKLVSK